VTNAVELYNPATGTWTRTNSLPISIWYHTATLLPNGKVLIASGSTNGGDAGAVANAWLYDTTIGSWAATGPLNVARFGADANLLPNGKVLVTAGQAADNSSLFSAELYDPVRGTWTLTANVFSGGRGHTSTLLANGLVMVTGGAGNNFTNAVEFYDVGLGFSAGWQPHITNATSPLTLSNNLAITGAGFRGRTESSGGNGAQNSPSDVPVAQLISLGNEQTLFLSSTNWQTNSFLSTPVTNFPPGNALLTVFANGIPSASSIIRIAPTPVLFSLTNSTRLTNGAFQFSFTNVSGAVFTTFAASNINLPLSNWTVVGNPTETAAGQFQFADTQATNSTRRFYRVHSP